MSSQSVWPSGACLDQGGSTCVFRGPRLCKLGVSCGGWGATGVGREAGVPSQPQSFMVRDFKGSLLRTDTKELVEWIQLPWSKWTSMALQIKRSGHGASLSTAQATKEEVKSPLSAGNRGGSRHGPARILILCQGVRNNEGGPPRGRSSMLPCLGGRPWEGHGSAADKGLPQPALSLSLF